MELAFFNLSIDLDKSAQSIDFPIGFSDLDNKLFPIWWPYEEENH